jgi:hypothetical protein
LFEKSKNFNIGLMGSGLATKKRKRKYSELSTVYMSNVKISNIIPYSFKSEHLIKVPRFICIKVITGTNDIILH